MRRVFPSARDILKARAADYEGPQRDESLQATDIATEEAKALALVEETAAELGLTIAKTYPPERRRCEHADGFPGDVASSSATSTLQENQRTCAPAARNKRSLASAGSPEPTRIKTPAEVSKNNGRNRISPSPKRAAA